MGSDHSPESLFQAVVLAAEKYPDVGLTVLATQNAVDQIYLQTSGHFPHQNASIEFLIAPEFIETHEEPLPAIRKKKNSSLVLGLKLLKKRQIDGFVSAGNTGAFIAGAALSLSLLPGIKRPALLASLPTDNGSVAIVDVGGNVSCKAHHLVQFAFLGAAYQRCCKGIGQPRVGLLNIGAESKKGTSEVRLAYELLQEMCKRGDILFVGNVEGREVFQGAVDVVVTDGFTGNVLLKASEGVSFLIRRQLQDALRRIIPAQSDLVLQGLHRQFDYEEHHGAIVCGVDGVAVKCHGQSSSKGLFHGIMGAIHLVRSNFIPQLKELLSQFVKISEINGLILSKTDKSRNSDG